MTHLVHSKHVLHASSWIPVVVFACTLAAQTAPPAQPAALTVRENTTIPVMTNAPISTRHAEAGQQLSFTVIEDVLADGLVAIPRGALVRGVVVQSKKSGALTGSPELTIKLVSLSLGSRTYPLYSYQFRVTGLSKTRPTQTRVVAGTAIGGSIGAASTLENSHDPGTNRVLATTAGMAAGAGVGTMVSAASSGPSVEIPAEVQIDFSLAAPITVAPVSAAEATRLAKGLHRGGPFLYVRGATP